MTTIAPPPPAPAAPPALTPAGRNAIRIGLVIAASVLVVGSVISLGVTAWGLSAYRVVADEQSLPKDMKSLSIDTGAIHAAVRLTTDRNATEPRVSMRLINTERSGDQTLAVAQEPSGARVTVSGSNSEFMDWGRTGEITVTLPPELSRRLSVTVRQEDSVLLAQADVEQLVVRATDGAVMLGGTIGRVDVRTEDGDVMAGESISVTQSFTAETVDGDVSVGFKDAAPRTIDVTTTDGDIAISLPTPGPYVVNASARDADIRVRETGDPAEAAAILTLRSVDGNVAVDTRGRR